MKLIIHAGLPKTGTSSLQIFLTKNCTILQQYGIYYPCAETSSETVGSGNAYWLYVMSRHHDKKFGEELIVNSIKKIKIDAIERGCNCVILSSEVISTLSQEDTCSFVAAAEQFGMETTVVLYLREPYQWCFSSWLQSIKRHGNTNWLFDSINLDLYFSLQPLLFKKTLLSQSSCIEVKLLDYSIITNGIGVVSSFINLLPFSADLLKHYSDRSLFNASIGKFEAFLLLYFNRCMGGDISLSEFLVGKCGVIQDEAFFFYDKRVDDLIAKHLNDCGEPYDPVPLGAEGDFTESSIFDTLTHRDKVILKKINAFSLFLVDRLDAFRENIVEKAHLYRNSPWRRQAGIDFDIISYLTLNIDVFKQDLDPYEHFVKFGLKEGRLSNGAKLF